MSPKEQHDAFMKLADFRLTRWNARRDSEWKIALAFWGLLVAATIPTEVRPPQGLGWWL
jgi:hypothetical protein